MPLEYENKSMRKYFFANTFSSQNKTIFTYGLFLFIIPLIPLSQLITGTIVNTLLIRASISLKSKKVFLLAIIPSIAAATGGILFGGFTNSLLLMLPVIWIGNMLLMFVMKKLFAEKKKDYFHSAIIGATTKTSLLFASSIVLFFLNFVPVLFLTAFGIIQFVTALVGSALVFAEKKAVKKLTLN